MSIFRFGGDSLIDELTVRHTEGGGVRAYLHARDGASPDALDSIKKGLSANALQWTPIIEDGRQALEVRGFDKKEEKLVKVLERIGAVPQTHQYIAESQDKSSFWERLKRNTLRFSGLSYFIGDAGFLSYGWKEAFSKVNGKRTLTNPQALAAGAAYAAGSPIILAFGHSDKSDLQLKHLSYNLLNELEAKGVEVPKDAAIRAVSNGHNATFVKKVRTFLERYPAEITNTLFGVAGSMIMWEKIKQYKTLGLPPIREMLKEGGLSKIKEVFTRKSRIPGQTAHSPLSVVMDIGLGSMSVIAGLISVFVDEEVPDPHVQRKTGIMGMLQKIKERPLAAASAFLGLATTAHGVSTYVDWKDIKSDLLPGNPNGLNAQQLESARELKTALVGRAVFVATNLSAEALMAVSSKGHGKGVRSDDSLEHSAYAVAADLVQRTVPEKREALIGTLTEFFSHKNHLAGDRAANERGIREHLAGLESNPWMGGSAVTSQQDAQEAAPEMQKGFHWRQHAMNTKAAANLATAPAF